MKSILGISILVSTTISFCGLPFLGCSDSGVEIGTVLGSFQYTAFDTTNAIVEQGELVLGKNESGRLAGRWSFTKSGSGELAGTISHDTIRVNLHPRFVDHNLILFGIMQGNTIRGTWTWIGFQGVIGRGTFEAVK